jgi:hypothetical protein
VSGEGGSGQGWPDLAIFTRGRLAGDEVSRDMVDSAVNLARLPHRPENADLVFILGIPQTGQEEGCVLVPE